MRRKVGIVLSLGLFGTFAFVIRKVLLDRRHEDAFLSPLLPATRAVITPKPFLEQAKPKEQGENARPSKAPVEAKKAEPPKPAPSKVATPEKSNKPDEPGEPKKPRSTTAPAAKKPAAAKKAAKKVGKKPPSPPTE